MILVCEPQCEGCEHVEFNAALLSSVLRAFGEPVLFLAEPGHLGRVAQRARAAGIDRVAYRPIEVPPRHQKGFGRMLPDGRLHREVLKLAGARHARLVIFSSTTTAGLFALKLMAGAGGALCVVIPHAVLESLDRRGRERWFPYVLRMPNPEALRFVFLSPSIEREVLAAVPGLAHATAAIEHPYLFSEPVPHLPTGRPVRFGSIGVALRERGLEQLIRLARATTQARPGRATFAHFGPLGDVESVDGARDVIAFPATRDFLPRDVFERGIQGVDYALFLSPPGSYRFLVSGAVMDAISLQRPIIALRNPFIEHCFERLGDIGYLLDSLEEIEELLKRLCVRFPRSHYVAQQEALRLGRGAFAPAAAGAALREALARWEARRAGCAPPLPGREPAR